MDSLEFVRIFTVVEGVFYQRKLEHARIFVRVEEQTECCEIAMNCQQVVPRTTLESQSQFRFEWLIEDNEYTLISPCNLTRLGDNVYRLRSGCFLIKTDMASSQ